MSGTRSSSSIPRAAKSSPAGHQVGVGHETTLEFELRNGVKFHSGKVMDADDVVYTLNHAANKENAIANFALLAWIKNAEKIDDGKVRVNLNRPFPPALAYLAGIGFIMQKGHYDSAPVKPDGKKDFGAVKPNGTGPYKIVEVRPGENIRMEKNTDYFKDGYKGEPKICELRFRTIKDTNTRTAELMTGAIDWMWDVPKDQAERITANPASWSRTPRRCASPICSSTCTAPRPEILHRQARAAGLAHAIDRESITKNLVARRPSSRTRRATPTSSPAPGDVPKYAYDPAKAKALLAEAGFAGGFEFDLYAYREREYTEAVIGDLIKIGIRPKLNYLQYTAFHQNVRRGKTPDAHGTWGSNSVPDISAITSLLYSRAGRLTL